MTVSPVRQIEGDPSAGFAYRVAAIVRRAESDDIEYIDLANEVDNDEGN